jgi:hypothetical protein
MPFLDKKIDTLAFFCPIGTFEMHVGAWPALIALKDAATSDGTVQCHALLENGVTE